MTQENYKYRTSPLMLRNQFPGAGPWQIPMSPKAEFSEDEFRNLRLLGFDRARVNESRHMGRMVHFFLYDYKFERVWKDPERDIERLKPYRAVLSPDFSMYLEMAPAMQLYNVFRNRWCGAYWASKGLRVIPTASWGDVGTFDFCFEGIPKGSTVAVSTYMVSEHGHHADQKEFFMKGYQELLRRVEPERIICYNEPFPEMEGDIVYVDYELSSWKYQGEKCAPSKYLPYICGEAPLPPDSGIVIKTGCVLRDDPPRKGMGSAYGGKWKPAKPEDERFVGVPGEIRVTYKKDGTKIETKIGPDGRAVKERHYTDKPNPKFHTNPHDHEIDWSQGFPNPGKPINYPSDPPEFKSYGGHRKMGTYVGLNSPEENRFKSIRDFKWCMYCGGEVLFKWKGKMFGISSKIEKTPGAPLQLLISQEDIENEEETELWCDTADEVLEYVIDGDRLRDIITQVEVIDRTI